MRLPFALVGLWFPTRRRYIDLLYDLGVVVTMGVEWEYLDRDSRICTHGRVCRYYRHIAHNLWHHDGSGPREIPLPPTAYLTESGFVFRPAVVLTAMMHQLDLPLIEPRNLACGRHVHIASTNVHYMNTLRYTELPIPAEVARSASLSCHNIVVEDGELSSTCRRGMSTWVRPCEVLTTSHYCNVNVNYGYEKDVTIEIRYNELPPMLAAIFHMPVALWLAKAQHITQIQTLEDILQYRNLCADAECKAVIDLFVDYLRRKRQFTLSWRSMQEAFGPLLDNYIVEVNDYVDQMLEDEVEQWRFNDMTVYGYLAESRGAIRGKFIDLL